jgi:hypothetical protein
LYSAGSEDAEHVPSWAKSEERQRSAEAEEGGAEKLARRDLPEKQKRWWRWQRAHGLCVSVRQETEEKELDRLAKYTRTKGGLRKLKKILRAARPLEQRQAV